MGRTRSNDNNEDGAKRRSLLQRQSTQLIMLASVIIGPAGITGLINAYTDPNVKQQSRIEQLEIESSSQKLKINSNKSKMEQQNMRMENYISGHEEQEKLRQQLNDKEFEHIRQLLLEIKEDVKSIKNGH